MAGPTASIDPTVLLLWKRQKRRRLTSNKQNGPKSALEEHPIFFECYLQELQKYLWRAAGQKTYGRAIRKVIEPLPPPIGRAVLQALALGAGLEISNQTTPSYLIHELRFSSAASVQRLCNFYDMTHSGVMNLRITRENGNLRMIPAPVIVSLYVPIGRSTACKLTLDFTTWTIPASLPDAVRIGNCIPTPVEMWMVNVTNAKALLVGERAWCVVPRVTILNIYIYV